MRHDDRAPFALTRRHLLQGSLACSALGAASLRRPACASAAAASPPTRPFAAELPIPPVARAVDALDPLPEPARHQRYVEFLPKKLYVIRQREAPHMFHPDLPVSSVWGYDGVVPGPTIRARHGEPVLVRMRNELPVDHVGTGMPETSTHLHGGHSASESDGFPSEFVAPGAWLDHHYPCHPAGGDPGEGQGTIWYHDHRLDFTAQNVYSGLAGFFLLSDDVDSNDEEDTHPQALRLPSGDYDVPIALGDYRFTPDGEVFFDPFDFDGFLGDRPTANGVIQPYFPVARRKYRLRFLNACVARVQRLSFRGGLPFAVVATDGNLLPAPLLRQSIVLAPAERVDLVVDFSTLPIGSRVILENRLEQVDGRGPTGKLLTPGTPVLRFDVDRPAADPSQVPVVLRTYPPLDPSTAVATRRFELERSQGAWQINGAFFDPTVSRFTVAAGTAEIWELVNSSGGWVHPMHVHLEGLRVLSRNGRSPPGEERGRKDTIYLGPNESVRIFARFRDFTGKYLMHCHNLSHEDHAMMIRFDVA